MKADPIPLAVANAVYRIHLSARSRISAYPPIFRGNWGTSKRQRPSPILLYLLLTSILLYFRATWHRRENLHRFYCISYSNYTVFLTPIILYFFHQLYCITYTNFTYFQGLLALEGELTPILVQMVKSANTNGLLDNDSDGAKYQNT